LNTDLELLQTELERCLQRNRLAILVPEFDKELLSEAMGDVRRLWRRIESKTSDRIPFQPSIEIEEVQS
jgi:hypothetical protein